MLDGCGNCVGILYPLSVNVYSSWFNCTRVLYQEKNAEVQKGYSRNFKSMCIRLGMVSRHVSYT